MDNPNLHFQKNRLLAKITGQTINSIFLGDYKLSDIQEKEFDKQLKLLEQGFPLDYLLGKIELNGLNFNLTPDTLIPREETQQWVDLILNSKPPFNLPDVSTLLDLATGSGFIGLSLASKFKLVLLTDYSAKALKVAKKNATNNNIPNLLFYNSNLLKNSRLQAKLQNTDWGLVSNLPYLPESDKKAHSQTNIKFEPEMALYSGVDGLSLFNELMMDLNKLTLPKFAVFELDPRNIQQAKQILLQKYKKVTVWKDFWGRQRVLIATNLTTLHKSP